MRYIKFLFVTIVVLLVSARPAAADKCEPDIYMFGYAFSFNDSTFYVTPVQKLSKVWVKRNGFVIERETYSKQLESYFESIGMTDMTCGVSYNVSSKKLAKKYHKIIERYKKKMKNVRIVFVKDTDFAFKSFVPLQIGSETDSAADSPKKSKKAKAAKSKK